MQNGLWKRLARLDRRMSAYFQPRWWCDQRRPLATRCTCATSALSRGNEGPARGPCKCTECMTPGMRLEKVPENQVAMWQLWGSLTWHPSTTCTSRTHQPDAGGRAGGQAGPGRTQRQLPEPPSWGCQLGSAAPDVAHHAEKAVLLHVSCIALKVNHL